MQNDCEVVKILLAAYKDHAGIVNTLWNIFQVVSLALVGLVYKEMDVRGNRRMLILVTIGFIAFAFGNQQAIMRSQAVVWSSANGLNAIGAKGDATEQLAKVLAAHHAPSPTELRVGHSLFALLVIAALWAPLFWMRTHPKRAIDEVDTVKTT